MTYNCSYPGVQQREFWMRTEPALADVLLSPAIQNLKKSLMEYVDHRLPSTPRNNPPASQSTTPTNGQPGPAPNQP